MQPGGGSAGLGTSPGNRIRFDFWSGSVRGTADKQRLCVRVHGIEEKFIGLSELNDLAQVHDGHPVADVFDDGEVVRDEKVGEAEFLLQVAEEIDDLRLNRDIERRDGFVGDNHFGLERKGAGNAKALPLTAGERVRVAIHVLGFESDHLQQVHDTVRAGTFGHARRG